MTLMELTGHEAGIIIYGDNSVGVFNWGNYDENRIPILAPRRHPYGMARSRRRFCWRNGKARE